MQKHTAIYMDFFGYSEGDFIPSELSGQPAVDINHIDARGMGGSKNKDNIFNLMALTREEHIKYGDKKQHKEFLREKHLAFMIENQPRKTEQALDEYYNNESKTENRANRRGHGPDDLSNFVAGMFKGH
jgi:hypothetical protein